MIPATSVSRDPESAEGNAGWIARSVMCAPHRAPLRKASGSRLTSGWRGLSLRGPALWVTIRGDADANSAESFLPAAALERIEAGWFLQASEFTHLRAHSFSRHRQSHFLRLAFFLVAADLAEAFFAWVFLTVAFVPAPLIPVLVSALATLFLVAAANVFTGLDSAISRALAPAMPPATAPTAAPIGPISEPAAAPAAAPPTILRPDMASVFFPVRFTCSLPFFWR